MNGYITADGMGALDLKQKAMDYADRLGVKKYTDAIFGASDTPTGMAIQALPERPAPAEDSISWTTIALYAVGGLLVWKVLTR